MLFKLSPAISQMVPVPLRIMRKTMEINLMVNHQTVDHILYQSIALEGCLHHFSK